MKNEERGLECQQNGGNDTSHGNRSLTDPPEGQETALLAAVKEYLAAVESGQRVDRQAFLARHTAVADELSDWLDGLAFVDSAVGGIRRGGTSGCEFVGAATSTHIDLSLAEPLGDFRLSRAIGRGGMGVVYEAVQLSLSRRVAVKVLPLAAALDARQLQRFKNEAYAAAQLHHTNIVPVYAIGCERSVHFYAMQLIEGQSLASVIAELRQSAETPRIRVSSAVGLEQTAPWIALLPSEIGESPGPKNESTARSPRHDESSQSTMIADTTGDLSTLQSMRRADFHRHVTRLGLQAAEALDYAHRQGVVHRDIKPENLLLDAQGNLWITDFGLAQFYSDARLTQTGAMVGTLRYMSPEQASGNGVVLDERADVYSLGMTLYELLTLEPALPGQSRAELLQQIGSLEPRAPRSIDRTIPTELETILCKAISKEPADRYRTAGALADDLRRFLHDEPIRARPPSIWDRAVKWTRRHKAVAASALVVLLLATMGSLVSTALIAREQAKTRAALVREQEQRQNYERSFRRAREVVDSFARIAVEEMDNPEFVHVRRQMLHVASAYYRQFLQERQDDPSIAAELASAQSSVETIHNEILVDLSAIEGFFRLWSLAELLTSTPVLEDELHLSADQQDQARELARELREEMDFPRLHELMWKSPDAKRAEVAALNGRAERGLSRVLSQEQTRRLRQIALQEQGPLAFTEPDVVERLKLTAEQLEAIRKIQSDYREEMEKTFRPRRGQHREDPLGDPMQVKEAAVARILEHLSPGQAAAWKELRGETVELDRVLLPFLGPPRGPRHGP